MCASSINGLGIAKIMKADSKSMHTKVSAGTKDFMSPGYLLSDNPTYGTSLDIFSFACVVLHVINQEWPTPKAQVELDPQTGKPMALNEVERRQTLVDKMKDKSGVLKYLVKVCLDSIPSKRPGITDVLKMLKSPQVGN